MAHENWRICEALGIIRSHDPLLRDNRIATPSDSGPRGQRTYDLSILAWIDFLERLKTAGMPIKKMISYADLWQRGPTTAGRRRKLLEEQRESVHVRIAELRSCLGVLDKKILKRSKLEKG